MDNRDDYHGSPHYSQEGQWFYALYFIYVKGEQEAIHALTSKCTFQPKR